MCDRFHHQLTPFNAERATQWLCRICLLFRRVIQRCSRVLLRAAWANRLLRLAQTEILLLLKFGRHQQTHHTKTKPRCLDALCRGSRGPCPFAAQSWYTMPGGLRSGRVRPPGRRRFFFPRGPRHLAQRYISVPQTLPFLPDGREKSPSNGRRVQNSAGPNKGRVAQTEFTQTPLQEELPGESHKEKAASRS